MDPWQALMPLCLKNYPNMQLKTLRSLIELDFFLGREN